jgi:hypothetical protein
MSPSVKTSAAASQRIESAALSQDIGLGLHQFARWLGSHHDIEKTEISRRRLVAHYFEFCELYDVPPLSPGRFFRSLKAAGFERRRLSKTGRPWV